jgi:hypothetical protein
VLTTCTGLLVAELSGIEDGESDTPTVLTTGGVAGMAVFEAT